jgi:hypothetical protein
MGLLLTDFSVPVSGRFLKKRSPLGSTLMNGRTCWAVAGLVAWMLTWTSAVAQDASAPPENAPPADGTAAAADVVANEAPASPLQDLAWLVGDWVDEDAQLRVETSVNWTKNGKFLSRAFRVTPSEGEPRSGMQLIAWDPYEERIRSWTYDSDGGFGEERWTYTDGKYTIRATYTLPDGGRASAIHVLRLIDDNTFGWKSVSRFLDTKMQPDIDEVIIYRKPSEQADEPPADNVPADNAPADGAANK